MASRNPANGSISDEVWDPSPSYTEFAIGSLRFFSANFARTRDHYSFPQDFFRDLSKCLHNVFWSDLYFLFVLSIGWTILRRFMTVYVFEPVGDRCRLNREGREKLPESGWKFVFYLISWCTVAYVVLVQDGGRDLLKPASIWTGYRIESSVSSSIYVIYAAQASFYLHSVYATLFLDAWRKDSLVLLLHHVITAVLLCVSWSARYHRSGLITIFLHDICDIFLEITKSCNYLKHQENRLVKGFERAADAGFLMFTVTWFVSRLYLFPLRLVYYSSVYVEDRRIQAPFGFFLNSLLFLLLAMNVYWFSIILNVLFKVITSQPLEDIRDFKEDEKVEEEKRELVSSETELVPDDSLHQNIGCTLLGTDSVPESGGYFLRQRHGDVLAPESCVSSRSE